MLPWKVMHEPIPDGPSAGMLATAGGLVFQGSGDKLVAKAPFGKWKTLTFVAALRCDRIDAPCVLDGPING